MSAEERAKVDQAACSFARAAELRPITWLSLPYWAARTAAADFRTYRPKKRALSARRLGRFWTPNLERPVFLVGAPRSGTTFLGSCLAALPEISYHFEPVATKAAARYVFEGRWDDARAGRFYRRVFGWLMRIHLDGDLIFAEKTPRNTFLVPFLHQCFPDARFIHIIRDGRDAALSLAKRPWLQAAQRDSPRREPGGYPYGPYARFWVEPARIREFETTSDIHRCIWSWRRHTEAGLAGVSQLPPEQHHELRYESLAARPADEARRLLDFLGITHAASCTAFDGAVATVSADSVGRWRRELSPEQLEDIEREAGVLLQRLGYKD